MVKRELEKHAAATVDVVCKHPGIYIGVVIVSILTVVGAFTIINWLF
jgi:hypothetical protein